MRISLSQKKTVTVAVLHVYCFLRGHPSTKRLRRQLSFYAPLAHPSPAEDTAVSRVADHQAIVWKVVMSSFDRWLAGL